MVDAGFFICLAQLFWAVGSDGHRYLAGLGAWQEVQVLFDAPDELFPCLRHGVFLLDEPQLLVAVLALWSLRLCSQTAAWSLNLCSRSAAGSFPSVVVLQSPLLCSHTAITPPVLGTITGLTPPLL